MAKYTVKNTTILHNKKTYSPGDPIELSDDDAAKLEAYITPVTTTEALPDTAQTAKKSNKKTDKAPVGTTTGTTESTKTAVESGTDNSSGTETTAENKEGTENGTETVQTPAN